LGEDLVCYWLGLKSVVMRKYLKNFAIYFLGFGVVSFFIFYPIDNFLFFIGRVLLVSLVMALTDTLLWDSFAKILKKR